MDISYRNTTGKTTGKTAGSAGRAAISPRDKWSFWTHFIGIILGIAATVYLFVARVIGIGASVGGSAGAESGALQSASFVIFGLAMIALYTGSSVYHYYNGPAEKLLRLRKLDHSMIYVMIAGSYTPVLANCLPMPKGAVFLAVMWLIAFAGIIIKVFWLDAPRWLYTSMYIAMGWAIMVDPHALTTMQPQCLALLAAGGAFYTIGAVIYILKKPNITEEFGFHEIFHCFILLGTALQFVGIAFYI